MGVCSAVRKRKRMKRGVGDVRKVGRGKAIQDLVSTVKVLYYI